MSEYAQPCKGLDTGDNNRFLRNWFEVEFTYVPVYNAFSGQTETMETKWANLKKMEEETFAKIIMGKADISEFDTFVENWKKQGGDQILKEINEELGN